MAIFEIRVYPINEGCMDEWVAYMDDTIAPYVAAKGVEVVGMFRGIEDPNLYTWIRRFEDDAARKAQSASIYDDHWVTAIKPNVRRMVDVANVTVHVVQGSPASAIK